MGLTTAPFLGTTVMKPSDSSWRKASRIGVLLMPKEAAMSCSGTRSPGFNLPVTMESFMKSTMRSRRVKGFSTG